MQRPALVLLTLSLFIAGFIQILAPRQSFAANTTKCTLSEPSKDNPVKSGTNTINLKIQTEGFVPGDKGGKYWIKLRGSVVHVYKQGGVGSVYEATVNGDNSIIIDNINADGLINPPSTNQARFEAGKNYTLSVTDPSSNGVPRCENVLIPTESNQAEDTTNCKIDIPKFLTPNDYITIRVSGLKKQETNSLLPFIPALTFYHNVVLKMGNTEVWNQCIANADLRASELPEESPISIGAHEIGTYAIEIRDHCNWGELGEQTICRTGSFDITKNGEVNLKLDDPCNKRAAPDSEKGEKIGRCLEVNTGLGIPIATTPDGFIKSIFGIVLGLAGGVALLLTIVSGLRLMTSQGNPEKVQGAKETLTSAIIGLVFIIFSLAILQIIGADILRIPGFKP